MTDQLAGRVDDAVDPTAPGDGAIAPAERVGAPADDDAPADEPGRRFGRRRQPRISKWDRPPEPHDWRFYVGTLGKVLIATGLLMFGFVAYQLWGTGIEMAREQNRLEGEFAALLEQYDVPDDAATDPGGPANPADAEADDPGADDDADVGSPVVVDDDPVEITTGEVTRRVPVAIDLSDQAVVQKPLPKPFRGDPLFRLEIPAIGRDDIVVAGVSLNDLKDGPGHYPDTPLPGQLGNAAVAGHRTTYGAPFFDVDRLGVGDELITTLVNGDRFVYEVTAVEVVSASDYWVVTTSDPDIAEFTLTSCHPKYTARDRIVVHSVLNPAKSSTVGFPTLYELEPDPDDAPIPGDDPVLVAEDVDPADIEISEPESALAEPDEAGEPAAAADQPEGSTTDASSDVAAASADDADDADDPAAVAATDDIDDPAADEVTEPADPTAAAAPPEDAFSQGWFDDDAAWPQIALWGLLLTVISLLAYQVSKRTRHDSIGFLVGIAPFLFALYFFFQNVNRLLPPGI